MIANYNFNPGLLTLKNSLDNLITIENSLDLLRTPWVLLYLPLMMWSLRRFLLDPHLCGFRVLVLLTNYGVTRSFTVSPCTYSSQGSQCNFYRNLWDTMDTLLFSHPLIHDDLFWSNLKLVRLLSFIWTISTELWIRSSAVFQLKKQREKSHHTHCMRHIKTKHNSD